MIFFLIYWAISVLITLPMLYLFHISNDGGYKNIMKAETIGDFIGQILLSTVVTIMAISPLGLFFIIILAGNGGYDDILSMKIKSNKDDQHDI